MSPASKAKALIVRAEKLKAVRSFFEDRSILEVDTPLLCHYPNIDTHIELFQLKHEQGSRYLHSSPEWGMKRLLALLQKDIYQMSHVFRAGEYGRKHHPEFTMIEWYRIGKDLGFLIEETLRLLALFIPFTTIDRGSYFDFFKKHTGIELTQATIDTLTSYCGVHRLPLPEGLDFYGLVDWIFSQHVEPRFEELTIIDGFPSWQKALAQVDIVEGVALARRFEIYFQGVELANGYDELTDAAEQAYRFDEENLNRKAHGKQVYPIDPRFLEALPHIPASVGVAVGFDRLMMLHLNRQQIQDILPFDFTTI